MRPLRGAGKRQKGHPGKHAAIVSSCPPPPFIDAARLPRLATAAMTNLLACSRTLRGLARSGFAPTPRNAPDRTSSRQTRIVRGKPTRKSCFHRRRPYPISWLGIVSGDRLRPQSFTDPRVRSLPRAREGRATACSSKGWRRTHDNLGSWRVTYVGYDVSATVLRWVRVLGRRTTDRR